MKKMILFACKTCIEERGEFVQPEWQPDKDHLGSEVWVCPSCGAVCGVRINEGKLELGSGRE